MGNGDLEDSEASLPDTIGAASGTVPKGSRAGWLSVFFFLCEKAQRHGSGGQAASPPPVVTAHFQRDPVPRCFIPVHYCLPPEPGVPLAQGEGVIWLHLCPSTLLTLTIFPCTKMAPHFKLLAKLLSSCPISLNPKVVTAHALPVALP